MFSITIHTVGFHFKHFIINKHHFTTFQKSECKVSQGICTRTIWRMWFIVIIKPLLF